MNQSLLLHLKFLVIFLFIFVFNNLFAQSKKGFKYLEEKKYAEAKIAFTKDLSDEKKAITARYGLNKVAIAAKDTLLSDLLSNINQALEAEEMIKKAPEKLKKKLQKDNINLSSIANQNIELQKIFIKYLGKYGDMSLVDSFLTIVPKPSRGVLTKFNVARTKIVSKSAEDASDYSSLQHLFKNHRNFVNKTNLKFSRNIENHLLELFVQEFGYEKFDVFAKDYPNFWLSKDCFVKEATDALKSKNLSTMLQFVREHPLSMMNELMYNEIIKNTYWKPTEKENLSESEQKQLESISKMVNLNISYHYTDGKIPDSTIVTLSKNIKENAPSVNAYYLMHRAIQYYLTNKKWKEAELLVTTMQPFFPDEFIKNCNTRYTYYSEKQDWFKSASTIIKREAEGLVVEAVRPISTYYGEEFSPVLSADGKTMYFAGSGRIDNFDGEDVFYATLKNGKWTNPMIIKELSGEGNEAPLSITADDNTMLLFIDGKLNTSERTLTGWSTPEPMSKAINSLPWIGRATLSSNGRTLLMEASKEEDVIWGESNIDIYMSQKDGNGQWSVPRAIGSDINTGGQERSPFLHADDKTLYFSSNGHKGLGEIDVYKTTRLDESWTRWSEPVNLGKEINTLDDDWGYSFAVSTDGRRAYLSTRRQQGSLSDIVTLGLPSNVRPDTLVTVSGLVKDLSQKQVASIIVVQDAVTGKILQKIRTRPDGTYSFNVPTGMKVNYFPEKKDYFSTSKLLDLTNVTTSMEVVDSVQVISNVEMKKGNAFVMPAVLFEASSFAMLPNSYNELNRLIQFVNTQKWKVQIIGHTDNNGSDEDNMTLSLQRADAVKQYMVKNGCNPNAVLTKGMGESTPIGDNNTPDGQAKNRRVELKVETN